MLATQSCLTLFDPTDYSSSGSSVHGILQARILKWIAIPFFRGFSQSRDQTQVSCIAGRFFTISSTREAHRSLVYTKFGASKLLIFLFSLLILLHYYKDTSFRALTLTALRKTEIWCSKVLI